MAKKELNKLVLLDSIDLSCGTQMRMLCPATRAKYLELAKEDCEFPPIEVIWTGETHIPWDGFHRIAVAGDMGQTHIRANVQIGNIETAQWLCLAANKEHGLPRTETNLRAIIIKILHHETWKALPTSKIASHVGCSRRWVDMIKEEMNFEEVPGPPEEEKKATEPKPRAPLTDKSGVIIPDKLADRWLSKLKILNMINTLDEFTNIIDNSMTANELTFALLRHSSFEAELKTLRNRLKASLPFALCVYCKDDGYKGCEVCHNGGFLNEMTYGSAPKKLKN